MSDRIETGKSALAQPSTEGPITIPSTISSTIAGSRAGGRTQAPVGRGMPRRDDEQVRELPVTIEQCLRPGAGVTPLDPHVGQPARARRPYSKRSHGHGLALPYRSIVGPHRGQGAPKHPAPITQQSSRGTRARKGRLASRPGAPGPRATVIEPSKWESSRSRVDTASAGVWASTSRRACWTAPIVEGTRMPGGREHKANPGLAAIAIDDALVDCAMRRAPAWRADARRQACRPACRPCRTPQALASAPPGACATSASQQRFTASAHPNRGAPRG